MKQNAHGLPPLPNRRRLPLQDEPLRSCIRLQSQRVLSIQKYQEVPVLNREKSSIEAPRNISSRKRARPSSVRSTDSQNSISSKESRKSSRPHYPLKTRMAMPSISSKSWVIYETSQAFQIYGHRQLKKRQVASLTKIMNLLTIIELLAAWKLSADQIRLRVSKNAASLIGTTAKIRPYMELSLRDLFYGMMLPSGNDAAFQVAEVGGMLLERYGLNMCPRNESKCYRNAKYTTDRFMQCNSPIYTYLDQMNKFANEIGMKSTKYANPHGLSNPENYSTAKDMATLCMYAMKKKQFRQIVQTKQYQCLFVKWNKEDEVEEQTELEYTQENRNILKWENTNKMLDKGWSGIKTGITPNAGPCLAASFMKALNGKQMEFLVILLSSKSMNARWEQAKGLVNWAIEEGLYRINQN